MKTTSVNRCLYFCFSLIPFVECWHLSVSEFLPMAFRLLPPYIATKPLSSLKLLYSFGVQFSGAIKLDQRMVSAESPNVDILFDQKTIFQFKVYTSTFHTTFSSEHGPNSNMFFYLTGIFIEENGDKFRSYCREKHDWKFWVQHEQNMVIRHCNSCIVAFESYLWLGC